MHHPDDDLREDRRAEPGRIVVSGTGRVEVVPDLAEVRLGIALTRPTVTLARSDAAAIQAAVIDAVTGAGVARRDIRTTDLSLHPRYDHGTGAAVLTGYELSDLVVVTVRDPGGVGEVVDAALAVGATSMDGLSFRVSDPAPAERTARERAVAAARSAATTLADAAGLVLGDVVDLVEGSGGGIPRPFAAKAERMLAADIGTPVEAGTTEVSVTVTATFAARPRP